MKNPPPLPSASAAAPPPFVSAAQGSSGLAGSGLSSTPGGAAARLWGVRVMGAVGALALASLLHASATGRVERVDWKWPLERERERAAQEAAAKLAEEEAAARASAAERAAALELSSSKGCTIC